RLNPSATPWRHGSAAAPFDLRVSALQRHAEMKAAGEDLRGAAEDFVATALLMPLMEQVRDDPFKSDLFHGGFTEDAFLRQFDQIIADRLSKRMSLPIVDSIYRQFERAAGLPEVDLHG